MLEAGRVENGRGTIPGHSIIGGGDHRRVRKLDPFTGIIFLVG
jgi:hypothetical protein